jgi:hypothetical protein
MGEERKVYKVLVGKPNNRLLGRLRHNGRMGSEWISGRLVGRFWTGTVTGSCEYSNVPLGFDATDLVSYY